MFERIDFRPIPHTGASQTIRDRPSKYERWPSQKYEDKRAGRTERQRNFQENLNRMALASGSDTLPVDFTARDGKQMYLDRGCIKMAENSRFICELSNDPDGVVSEIKLSNPPWTGERQRQQTGLPASNTRAEAAFEGGLSMSERHAFTARGERAHKWIVYGSIVGIAVLTLVLAVTGVLEPAV